MICCLVGLVCHLGKAQKFVPNYDEAKVPEYSLPNALEVGGRMVRDHRDWENFGRAGTLEMFRKYVYGRVPKGVDAGVQIEIEEERVGVFGGIAVRRQYLVTIGGKVKVRMLVYVPKNRKGRVPGFLGLNFLGNHTVDGDKAVVTNRGYVIGGKIDEKRKKLIEESRGKRALRWSAKKLIERGYALATACRWDLDPDFDDGFQNGVHVLDEGQRGKESWGTIAGWAWGLSRLLDALGQIDEVDETRIAVVGHSRLGKTALWAGALDQRFAMAISNNSGCGGAALSRRIYGETVERITSRFPHWFCEGFKEFSKNEGELPVDQHQLIALMAPRPVYVASATQDLWADPKGEFLSWQKAKVVYDLFGGEVIGVEKWPEPGRRVGEGRMGYHLRQGKHDMTQEDWGYYLDFADRWL